MALPSPQVLKAFQAMSALGLTEQQVKPVLKNLVKLYNKDWSLIEAENYRALADAIFDAEDAKATAEKKKCNSYDEVELQKPSEPEIRLTRGRLRSQDENSSLKKKSPDDDDDLADNIEEESLLPHRPLKRLRLQNQECQAPPSVETSNPTSGGSLLLRPKMLADTQSAQQPHNTAHSPESRPPVSPQSGSKDKGKRPLISNPLAMHGKNLSERSSNGVHFKEKFVESGSILLPKQNSNSLALIEPKDEPFTDDMAQDEVPIAVILPEDETADRLAEPVVSQETESRKDFTALSNEEGRTTELATIPEGSPSKSDESSCLEVASSPLGEVKLSLSCNSAIRRPGFQMPNLDAILKLTEDKYLHTYRITDPNFTLRNLLGHMCESFLELATNSNDESQDGSIDVAPNLALQKSPACDSSSVSEDGLSVQPCDLFKPIIMDCPSVVIDPEVPRVPFASNGDCAQVPNAIVANGSSEDTVGDSLSMVVAQNSDLTPDHIRIIHDMSDVSRGEERVRISVVNEWSKDQPPSFFYITKNIIHKDADFKTTLSSIGDKDCCSSCFGDCLSSSVPCVCARQTGGMYVYTPEGLIKDDILEECISMTRNPQPDHLFYCKSCPLERVKNDDCLESCKGHLRRNFIKECWVKCGCHAQCGNRVVQRGLNCNLQVFFTPEGKGWGLRTLDDLPKGVFVCEYVGEILTNKERHQGKMRSTKSGKRPYPVLLDADWGSKACLRDEDACCLDATKYGNVARFINHRCLDANLVLIPVEVETPDRLFYHVAFFTTRKVDALEELTWDYGIDFDDHDDPVKVFDCQCGSKFCRNMTRSNRSRSSSLAS